MLSLILLTICCSEVSSLAVPGIYIVSSTISRRAISSVEMLSSPSFTHTTCKTVLSDTVPCDYPKFSQTPHKKILHFDKAPTEEKNLQQKSAVLRPATCHMLRDRQVLGRRRQLTDLAYRPLVSKTLGKSVGQHRFSRPRENG